VNRFASVNHSFLKRGGSFHVTETKSPAIRITTSSRTVDTNPQVSIIRSCIELEREYDLEQ